MHKKLVLGFSVNALIKPEINLIKSILRTSSILEGQWRLAKDGACDAIIFNDISTSIKPFTTKPGTKRIFIKRRGETSEGYVFFRPIRAEELVKLLVQIQTGVVESESQSKHWEDILPGASYKLRKWPTSDILKINKKYMKLATYISRQYKTIKELSELSGNPEQLCSEFISHLEDAKILLMIPESSEEKKRPYKILRVKKSFISQLKRRFSTNQ
ncbi:MAG: hypothetical protein K6L75_03415 [Cellvibrionaceae bacterium]